MTTVATSAPTSARNSASAWATASRKACSQASPVAVKRTRRARRVLRIGLAHHQAPGFALVHQVAHGLLAHAGALRQVGQARALQREMAGDVDVGGADLRARGQVGQGQRHVDVVRHQVQHPLVEAAHGMAQQPAQVGEAPAVVDVGRRVVGVIG